MDPSIEPTPIPGLLVLTLPVHRDARGWFKETWQRQRMVDLGLPDFGPVQHNVSFNQRRGVTRGVHAEPWDKLVSIAAGRVFGAWVDLRRGPGFGRAVHREIGPETAVFVPRGVGNAYQALEDGTSYTYLVNDHWRPGGAYPALDLGDPDAAIPWPIDLDRAEVSAKDRANPRLRDVAPVAAPRTLVTGARGQLGRALAREYPDADLTDLDELDLTDPAAMAAWPWREYDVVLNAAGFTDVDGAEGAAGRRACWAANAAAPAALARLAIEHRLTLVHYSTDYVFDGSRTEHPEDEPLTPLGVYGQSKAAGDLAVGCCPRHYLLRTSWVVGEGRNFVRTMQALAARGVSPRVVDDQVGRLTFTTELARATRHLLESGAPYGTYNVTSAGPAMSWAEVAREVFRLSGRDPADVTRVSTEAFRAGGRTAPRPACSVLALDKLRATGFEPGDAVALLRGYVGAVPELCSEVLDGRAERLERLTHHGSVADRGQG